MNTLTELIRIWRAMLYGSSETLYDGDIMLTTKIYPEGRLFIGHHKPAVGTDFRGDWRLLVEHAEYDLKIHLLKCIFGRIDWARQMKNAAHPEYALEVKWILGVSDLYELLLDTLEVELSKEFQVRYSHIK